MGPARAMGTFLRVWRSEWAQLSRAQLAIAVSAQMANGKAVTPRAVRWWEEGNPPGSTEEFEGLCTVMRRNGLTRPEVEDFRKAVLASCLDRQYPELFRDGDFARRDDVDDAARRLWSAASASPAENTVGIVAHLTELRDCMSHEDGRATSANARKRCQVAFALLQNALAAVHRSAGRGSLADAVLQANSDLLVERFGGGLGHPVTAEWNEVLRLHSWAYRRGFEGDPVSWVGPHVLRQYREASSQRPHMGDSERSAWLWTSTDLLCVWGGVSGLRREHCAGEEMLLARSLEPELLESCDKRGGGHDAVMGMIAGGEVDRKLPTEAERHLWRFDHWRTGTDMQQFRWEHFSGRLAWAREDWNEALDHLARAQAIARRLDDTRSERGVGLYIEECEDGLRKARLRRGGSPNGKSGGKEATRKPGRLSP